MTRAQQLDGASKRAAHPTHKYTGITRSASYYVGVCVCAYAMTLLLKRIRLRPDYHHLSHAPAGLVVPPALALAPAGAASCGGGVSLPAAPPGAASCKWRCEPTGCTPYY